MPNYIKIKTGQSSWSTATKAYVKKSTGWVQPIRIWMKLLSGWTRIWPVSGPFALTSPFIVSTPSGSTHIMPTTPLRIGTTYYGRNGTWDANGWTISSYKYEWRRYNLQFAGDDSGQTTRSSGTFSSPSIAYTPAGLDDKKYLSFYISPTTTDTLEMSEAESGDDDGRLFVIRRPPINILATLSSDTKVGTEISYGSAWNITSEYFPENSRTLIAWYRNTSATLTGATAIKVNLASVAGAYTYTPVNADIGNYIIAKETTFNSGSDYADGYLTLGNTVGSGTPVGVSAVAITSSVIQSAIIPTITMAANSSVTSSSGRINWTSTNQASFSVNGVFATSGTTATTAAASGLSPNTTYTGTVVVTSSTGNTASANYSLTTLPVQYTITWNANGGTGGGTTVQNQGVAHTAPSPGTRDGFDFAYYRYPESGGTNSEFVASGGTYTPTANMTWGAVWTAKTYLVTFDANGGTGAPASQIKTHGTNLTLSSTAPTRATVGSSQFTFAGWNTAANGTGTSYSAGAIYTLNAPLSLFAQWTVTTLNWSISWNANGGTGGGTTTLARGLAHTAPSPGTRAGFTFSQWRKPEFGGDPTFVANNGTFTPTANDAFWAQWTVTPIIPTITMAANSSVTSSSGRINWTSTNQASFSVNGVFATSGTTATTAAASGLSPNTTYTGTVVVTSSTGHTASANYSLTTLPAQYTVTWNANGGTGGGSTGPFNAGTSHTAPSPGTRSGFTFAGYRETPSGDSLYGPIFSGGSFNPPSTITMYARWSPIVPSVTQITALGLGNASAPYIRFTTTSTNAASLSIMLYRSSSSSTGPWTPLGSPSIQSTSGTQISNFNSRTGTGSNWYYVEVTPYFGASGTGTAGTTVTSRVKRGTDTTTTTVYP